VSSEILLEIVRSASEIKAEIVCLTTKSWELRDLLNNYYCTKGTSPAEVTLNIKPVALTIVEFYASLKASGSLLVSQKIPLNRKFLKFCSNLLKAFRVDLKTFLGLVLPNQYCPIVVWEKWGWFLGDIFRGPRPSLGGPDTTIEYIIRCSRRRAV